MFFTRANGQRIDAIREEIASWQQQDKLSEDELAYLLVPLIYAASYASNTSGVFKGFHNGWGGKTHTALYRILGDLSLTPPILFDNGQDNIALQEDSQQLAGRLSQIIGSRPDIVYIDPPYNQHPYASNYHVLNTIVLWDKPPLKSGIQIDCKIRDKSAIRKDWRTQRRSPYNHRAEALSAFRALLEQLDAHWALVSYSTDGNIAIEDLLTALAERGDLYVFTEQYKRYRVSTPRMSARSHNIEFVAVVNLDAAPSQKRVREIIEEIHKQEASIHVGK